AQSMGSVGDSYDNALMENFFSTLKTELVYRNSWRTREDAENALFSYIDGWYNTQRIQKKLIAMPTVLASCTSLLTFSIIDTAILRLWRALGRSERDFTDRRVLDHKLCYLGNTDSYATLDITVKLRRHRNRPNDELVDVVIHDQRTSRILAIADIHTLTQDRSQP
ncbi:IS3 family transposase, partial [Nocardia wallacei]|uniref:IS3 family transposase n=1 Tax=Nocardia wallacei TaxID=480035 RepID=UPI003CC7F226